MTSAYTLAAGETTLEVLPHLGAKVTSLRSGEHEWLAGPERPLSAFPDPPGPWGDHDCSGWDECFPNVGGDAALGLADHGVAWSSRWVVLAAGPTSVTTRLETAEARFERRLELAEGGRRLVAGYRVEALTGQLRWAWAQHPLLAADTGTRIQLPHPTRVRVDSALRHGVPDPDASWLAPDGVLAADTVLATASGRAAKLWFDERPAWVRVVRDGRAITWRLDRTTAPHTGLWVNLGGWDAGTQAPLGHVAVEPAYGAQDDFGAAQTTGAGPVLRPGEEHAWHVVVELDPI